MKITPPRPIAIIGAMRVRRRAKGRAPRRRAGPRPPGKLLKAAADNTAHLHAPEAMAGAIHIVRRAAAITVATPIATADGISAALTGAMIRGAMLIATAGGINATRTGVMIQGATPIATAGEISAMQTGAMIRGAMPIATAGEISATPTGAMIQGATPIATADEISAAQTGVMIQDETLIATAGGISAAHTGIMIRDETPITRAAGINGVMTGGIIVRIATVAPGMAPAVNMATGRQVTATLFITAGMIRSGGCSSTGAGIFIPALISAIAIRFPKPSFDAAVDMKKWRFCATTIGVSAISSRAAGEFIALGRPMAGQGRLTRKTGASSAPVFLWRGDGARIDPMRRL